MATPTDIRLRKASKRLEIVFDDGAQFEFTCEFLRVHSPSAEVRGHGAGQEVLQAGKADVNIVEIEPVGNYAVRLVFDDGHQTGLYSWDLLYRYGQNQEAMWQRYLKALDAAGASREAQTSPETPGHD
ncbi:MAG: DUF971 domain-containing protein [Gammaproteobacteria bacterium]|nr:DUF971 domain-containing protein [Gammaproteobacteria bacterium]